MRKNDEGEIMGMKDKKFRETLRKEEKGTIKLFVVITIIIVIMLLTVSISTLVKSNGLKNKAKMIEANQIESEETKMSKSFINYDEKMSGDESDTTIEALIAKINELEASVEQLNGEFEQQNKEITDLKNNISTLDKIYPVGSIYISTQLSTASAVAQELGGGTWQSYAAGRTTVGVGTGTDSSSTKQSFTVNSTGGEYKHKLSAAEMASHTHNFNTRGSAMTIGTNTSHNELPLARGYLYGRR